MTGLENDCKKIAVLIVAGGSGTRMGAEVPKQFLSLAGKPVIVRSVECFLDTLPQAAIYVALGTGMEPLWEDAAGRYGLAGKCRLCRGGETRFQSVRNALALMEPCDIVLIHDAVRPLVSRQVIHNVIGSAAENGTAVPVTPAVDSFRIVDGYCGSVPFDRNSLRAVQTPQGFLYGLITEAYRQPYRESFTDDAQVAEALGYKIALCPGSHSNLKLTYPEDITIAEAILSAQAKTGNT